MGNVNSNDLVTKRSDANLILFLLQQWKTEVNSDRRSLKSDTLPKQQWNTFSRYKRKESPGPNKLSRSGSFNAGKPAWKSLKHIRNGTQSVKSYKAYSKEKEIEFLSENPLYEWKARSMEELTAMKEDMHRKEIRALESCRMSGRSKAKRHFRKRKRKQKERENEMEMWTLTKKPAPFDQMSIKSTKSEESEKIFWKTSKLSLTELHDVEGSTSGSQNMLWRSSKHIQTFYGENVVDVKEVSSAFEGEKQKMLSEDSSTFRTTLLKTEGRKRRFSRWTFLRHEPEPPKETKKPTKTAKRSASFRVPQKMYSKYNKSEKCSRDVAVKGKRKWKLFKESWSATEWANEEGDESCDCSCCSCNGCQSKENKKSSDTNSLLLSH